MNYKTNHWKFRERGALVLRSMPRLIGLLLVIAVTTLLFLCIYFRDNIHVKNMVNLNLEPRISLRINANETIVDAIAYSEEGEALLEPLDLKNVDLHAGLHSVVAALRSEGYIDDETREIGLSVTGRSFDEAELIRYRLRALIELMLEEVPAAGSGSA